MIGPLPQLNYLFQSSKDTKFLQFIKCTSFFWAGVHYSSLILDNTFSQKLYSTQVRIGL